MESPTAVAHEAAGIFHEEHDDPHGAHVPDLVYIKVAIGLAALTAIEVVLSYVHALKGIYLIIPLLVVMGIKFFIVGAFFMHLKFDKPVLNRIFYAGIFLACSVYLAALATFHFFRY